MLATLEIRTLLAPLLRVQVPGRFALGFAAGFATYSLQEGYGVVEVKVSMDDEGWTWSTDLLGAGNQMFRQMKSLKEMVGS